VSRTGGTIWENIRCGNQSLVGTNPVREPIPCVNQAHAGTKPVRNSIDRYTGESLRKPRRGSEDLGTVLS
jgi:hypothetical protein